eukprot:CAMPEP_0169175314 /NCGR_PEP_ID=MMETSP1015-20121227/65118_1 /TAXON_ID=342587 /ORGANISM="Karlodinium micrum, Strain CCMP2283" /LENGTH=45 /DNA_ID= /DNA_START= /DNA_END= /DNA_ORIENTATION=
MGLCLDPSWDDAYQVHQEEDLAQVRQGAFQVQVVEDIAAACISSP